MRDGNFGRGYIGPDGQIYLPPPRPYAEISMMRAERYLGEVMEVRLGRET